MLEKGENPERFATLQYFKLYPVEKWKWWFDFIEQIKSKKPNEGHHAILKYQEYWQKNKINWTLITQNIDNYHAELLKKSDIIKTVDTEDGGKGHGFTNGVLEIHGNTLYMRCLDECCENIYTIPPLDPDLDIEDQIPKWNKCGSIMRPNILWFDESYWDEYYKLDWVKTAIESDVDALIVVGTALTTALAFKIVKEWLKRDILTIEVNLEPEWKVGHSVQVIEKSETALPILLKTYK